MPTDPKGEEGLREALAHCAGLLRPWDKKWSEHYAALATRAPSALTEAAKGAREAKVLEAARSIADQARVCIRIDDPGNDRVGIRVHTLRSLQEALAEVEGERS